MKHTLAYNIIVLLTLMTFLWSCKKYDSNSPPVEEQEIFLDIPIYATGQVVHECDSKPVEGVTMRLNCDNYGFVTSVLTDSNGYYVFDFVHHHEFKNASLKVAPPPHYYKVSPKTTYYVNNQLHSFNHNWGCCSTRYLSTYDQEVINYTIRQSNTIQVIIEILNPAPSGDNYVEFEFCSATTNAPPYNCISYFRDSLTYVLYGEGWWDFNYKMVRDTDTTFHTDSVYLPCYSDTTFYLQK